MFKKPFKLRFQNQLKNSEKKKFGNDLKALFPALNEEDITSLLSNKESVVRMKITTFKEEDLDVYCINKTPMYMDVTDSGIKLPTVFMLWRFPHMLPTFTTSDRVLNKLKNGADLFFPGIYTEGLFFCDIDFKKNDAVGVNLVDNKAAVAVGRSLLDKDDVMDRNKNDDVGKLVKIYHTVGDYLFKMQSDSVVLQLGPPDWALPVSEDLQLEDDSNVKSKGETVEGNVGDAAEIIDRIEITDSDKLRTDKGDNSNNGTEPEKETSSDDLLEYCFLKALKTIPKTCYPILPATFYAKYILTNLPPGKNLNLRKTKWKKFSTFLQEKSLEGFIKLQQLPKNDFTIAGANADHLLVKGFVDPHKVVSVVVETRNDSKPVVQQVYHVSAQTLPFFAKFGLKKRDELTRNDVRNRVNEYVRSENLADPEKPEIVILDPILCQILKEEVTSRSNLLAGLLSKMSVEHKVSNCCGGDAIVHKGKMPSIEFETFVRTGNKKVTVISNLESFGVNASNFSKELQHKAAASTTIIPVVPGKKGPQVQVQGNQIAIAFEILKEKYNITEKCMKGLEKALKSKTKK